MEVTKDNVLKLEVLTMSKNIFKQMPIIGEAELRQDPVAGYKVIGTAICEGSWVILEWGTLPAIPARARLHEYIAAVIPPQEWGGSSTKVSRSYPQIYLK